MRVYDWIGRFERKPFLHVSDGVGRHLRMRARAPSALLRHPLRLTGPKASFPLAPPQLEADGALAAPDQAGDKLEGVPVLAQDVDLVTLSFGELGVHGHRATENRSANQIAQLTLFFIFQLHFAVETA